MITTSAKTVKPVAPQSIPPLIADLDAEVRRLKLAAIRRTAPEVLITANTQRGTPEEVLRTLVETELAVRDASNVINRLKAAGFPVTNTLESFDVVASSIQPMVFDYLFSLEWIRTQQNLPIIGPAGTGKSHTLIGLGSRRSTPGTRFATYRCRPRRNPLPPRTESLYNRRLRRGCSRSRDSDSVGIAAKRYACFTPSVNAPFELPAAAAWACCVALGFRTSQRDFEF